MARSDGDVAVASAVPTDPKQRKRFARDLDARAEHLGSVGRRLLKQHGRALPESLQRALAAQLDDVARLRGFTKDGGQIVSLLDAVEALDAALDEHLGRYRKSVLREYTEAILWAVALTLVIRAFVFEAFKIPTGSMIPTLQIRDHLFVNKFIYGLKIPFTRVKFFTWRTPHPGEIIVFEYPYDDDPESTGKDLIKRVIGAPGDRIRLIDNTLQVNGKPIKRRILDTDADCSLEGGGGSRCVVARECLNGHLYTAQHHRPPSPGLVSLDAAPDWPTALFDTLRSGPHARGYSPPENAGFPDFVVPSGHLLVMGDNRDNSKDGRFFGLVPFDTVKGKAGILWYATDWKRIGNFVHEETEDGTCDPF
ncbi:MAG: signal peptidase I [Myxococcales bacterium]|nr:signal peptidase I [Myxococcales bacterium]